MPELQWAITWYGRGGQGAVTASNILAKAAFIDGFRFVQSFPFFGPERRGAPVKAYTRISRRPINDFTSIYSSDVLLILDQKLVADVNPIEEINPGGYLIINASGVNISLDLKNHVKIFQVNANDISLKLGLQVAGLPVVNTCMLGAFSKATALVKLDTILKVIEETWSGEFLARNLKAAELAYETCRML